MNDQIPPWENNWRDTLADYEAPLQPTDWAAMDALLDGGSAAPPEVPAPGPGASGLTAAKVTLIGLGLVLLSSLTYFLGRSDETIVRPKGDVNIMMTDSIPDGYRYRISTTRQLDQRGNVTEQWTDTSYLAVKYRMDTVYLTDEKGNLQMQIDTTEIPLPVRISPDSVRNLLRPWRPKFRRTQKLPTLPVPGKASPGNQRSPQSAGGTSVRSSLVLPKSQSYLAPVPPPAPAAPPVSAGSPEEQSIRQQRLNNPRTRVVYPILSRPPTGLPGFTMLFRLRLEKAIREHPVELVYPPFNNGYFPPIKGEY